MNFELINKKIIEKYGSFEAFLDYHRTYGLSMALIEDYKISEIITYGLKQAIDQDTLFQAASMSKSIFAVTVMRLNEMGLVDIEKSLTKRIKKVIELNHIDSHIDISYIDLLSHTAGFNVHGFEGYLHHQEIPTTLQILRGERPANSLKLELIHSPKSTFSYSGGGYMLAQYLIEEETNRSYESWVQELVFKPLKMNHSLLTSLIKVINQRTIASAWSAHDTPIENGYVFYPELSAAGLWSTPADLSLFGIEIMKALYGESQLLTRKSAERLISMPLNIKTEYGLGFQIQKISSGIIFGHGGNNIGYHGRMCFCPLSGNGLVVMVNSDIGSEIPDQIINSFIEDVLI